MGFAVEQDKKHLGQIKKNCIKEEIMAKEQREDCISIYQIMVAYNNK